MEQKDLKYRGISGIVFRSDIVWERVRKWYLRKY